MADAGWSGDVEVLDNVDSSADGSARESDLDFLVFAPFWSTGKKWHSFFNRMQFWHLLSEDSLEGMHRIFRRRQWPRGGTLVFPYSFPQTLSLTTRHRCSMVAKFVALLAVAARNRG